MKVLLILDFPSQISCLAKFLLWSYCLKCSWLIRLQDSMKCNISKNMEELSWFFVCRQTLDFCTSWCYWFWWTWPGMPKVPKITVLQYLCNIFFKKGGINMIFPMKISIKVFNKLVVLVLLVMASYLKVPKIASLQTQERSEEWS